MLLGVPSRNEKTVFRIGEDICDIPKRDLYPKYVKNSYNSKIGNVILKWENDLNRHFSREDM